jgi:hypothetical protein
MGHPRLGYYFLDIGLKDFVFAIFQIQNLYGINLNEKYWIIQIIQNFMVVVIFCIHMYLSINILVKNQKCKK